MNNQHGRGYQANLGATFYPGGHDDFYMPEVISPAPQRIMPEVPENMQDNLAHLEQQAHGNRRPSGPMSPGHYDQGYPPNPNSQPQYGNNPQYDNAQYVGRGQNGYTSPQAPQQSYHAPNHDINQQQYQYQGQDPNQTYAQQTQSYLPTPPVEEPTFSPFPALRNPPPNVPPTDDQREANLETGRQAVLASSDAQYQLDWAQDALSYVEVAQTNEERLSMFRDGRPHTPRIEHQLKVDAINIVGFLQKQGHPKAEFIKGTWLEWGKFDFREDRKEAFRCYQRAADGGYARAEYRIGMQFESSNEIHKAIPHYQKGVAANDSASNYRLGMMILQGQNGMQQDYPLGLRHVREAALTADENAPQGAYVYGMLQARELPQVNVPEVFLPTDMNSARVNIEKAAFLGFAKAQVKMGAAYELCQLGCDFNPALSIHYNALAARQGEADAEMAISKWFLCGHEGVFDKNEQLSFEYAQRAAQSGLSTAEFAMGYFYEIGIYVQSNLKEARKWYQKAAANGNKDAAGRIEGISRSKTMSRKDHENVALARIKSQHAATQYNQQQNQVPPMPQLPPMAQQRPLEMPDVSKLRIQTNPYGDPQRPPSAAPYPGQEGMHGGRPRPGDGYFNPEVRPGSAFGINPNLNPNMRPSSAATGGRPDNYRVPSGQQRPYSHADGGYGPGQGPPNQRLPSGPGGPAGYRPQGGYPQPSPGGPHQGGPGTPHTPQGGPGMPPPQGVNIGYIAPLDPRNEQRGRLQKVGNPNMGKPQPQPPMNPDAPPPRKSSRTPGAPPSEHNSRTSSPSQYGGPPAGYPSNPQSGYGGRMDSAPNRQNVRPAQDSRPPPSSGPKPPLKQTGGPAAGAAGAAGARPAQRPPGKGPKTFEEMGVPQGKGDSDCIVM